MIKWLYIYSKHSDVSVTGLLFLLFFIWYMICVQHPLTHFTAGLNLSSVRFSFSISEWRQGSGLILFYCHQLLYTCILYHNFWVYVCVCHKPVNGRRLCSFTTHKSARWASSQLERSRTFVLSCGRHSEPTAFNGLILFYFFFQEFAQP